MTKGSKIWFLVVVTPMVMCAATAFPHHAEAQASDDGAQNSYDVCMWTAEHNAAPDLFPCGTPTSTWTAPPTPTPTSTSGSTPTPTPTPTPVTNLADKRFDSPETCSSAASICTAAGVRGGISLAGVAACGSYQHAAGKSESVYGSIPVNGALVIPFTTQTTVSKLVSRVECSSSTGATMTIAVSQSPCGGAASANLRAQASYPQVRFTVGGPYPGNTDPTIAGGKYVKNPMPMLQTSTTYYVTVTSSATAAVPATCQVVLQ